MCEEFAWTAPGVSQAQFEEFLEDEADNTDDDSRLVGCKAVMAKFADCLHTEGFGNCISPYLP